MSLLNSVLGSIGSGNRMPLPKGPDRAATNTPPPVTKQTPGVTRTPNQTSATKLSPQYSGSQYLGSSNSQQTSTKRKLDGENDRRSLPGKSDKPGMLPDRSKVSNAEMTASMSKQTSTTGQQQPVKPKKEPPKGSYLALLEQAKAVQAEKATKAQGIGMIKHAASSKERLSKVERRRREQEFRTQTQGKAGRVAANGAIKKPGQPANGKARGPEIGGYKGTAKPPAGQALKSRTPVQPRERQEPSYKGTAGLKKPPSSKAAGKGGREDRYYDEEDDGWLVDDDEDEGYGHGPKYRYAEDYDSESDMEAGYSDVEHEETAAERQARLDDAREKALEERLKREKEARKKSFERGR